MSIAAWLPFVSCSQCSSQLLMLHMIHYHHHHHHHHHHHQVSIISKFPSQSTRCLMLEPHVWWQNYVNHHFWGLKHPFWWCMTSTFQGLTDSPQDARYWAADAGVARWIWGALCHWQFSMLKKIHFSTLQAYFDWRISTSLFGYRHCRPTLQNYQENCMTIGPSPLRDQVVISTAGVSAEQSFARSGGPGVLTSESASPEVNPWVPNMGVNHPKWSKMFNHV